MASNTMDLEDMTEDRNWIDHHDRPRVEYEKLSRDERMMLLRQVRKGTVILKFNAKKTECSFDDGKIVIKSVLSGWLRQKLDSLVSKDYIRRYTISGNNGTSVIKIHNREDNGYNCTKSTRTIILAFRDKPAKEARERLMLGNQPLVIFRAKEMRQRHSLKESLLGDLIQEGQFGLYSAIDLYRPERHTEFSTYATRAINNAIKRAISSSYRAIKLSRPMTSLVAAVEADACENGISFIEACNKRKLTPKTIKIVSRARDAMNITSFSETFCDDGEFRDIIPYSGDSGEKVVERNSAIESVFKLLDRLPRRYRAVSRCVIEMRYLAGASLEDVGRVLQVSKERVRQIEARAILKLRKYAKTYE
ncbi:MAG: sigma-70 family RNA polymerase sigma factor [Nanoarchaeota archaeon]